MPVTLQLAGLKYKNGQGQFQSADCLKGEDADVTIFAPDYGDLTFPVTEGTLCTHSEKLYAANQSIQSSEAWMAAHWDETSVDEIISALKTGISGKADKAGTVLDTTLSRGRKANTTVGTRSFAFGNDVEASGQDTQAVGDHTTASGKWSRAEGVYTIASGTCSKAEGAYTEANHRYQHALGAHNVPDPSTAAASAMGNYIEIVGNGTANNLKSNARTLDWSGNERLMGDVYVGCNADSTGGSKLAKVSELPDITGKADMTNLVPAFNASKSGGYAVDEMCSKDGAIYKCTTAHTGAWDASHFVATNLGDELQSVNGAISELYPDATSADVGKAIIVKTVANGKPETFELGAAGGGGSDLGLSVVNGELCVTYEEASA